MVRNEFGADAAGAVVQQLGKPVGNGASGAEPTSVQLAFFSAAGASIGHHEARTVGADLHAVARP
jgi:hypothetical protein